MSNEIVRRGRLVSIQVGRVKELQFDGLIDGRPVTWSSGIYKSGVDGPVRVTAGGIDGDQQSDLENHGGPDNVVLAYAASHYPEWRNTLSRPDLSFGNFGENFTVEGFTDDTVCIGDIWRVGPDLVLQVTQARQPCFKLARRLGVTEIVKLVRESGRGGWYLRVLKEGPAEAGMEIALQERKHPEWPVARAVQAMYARRQNADVARDLAKLPELSARWKRELLLY